MNPADDSRLSWARGMVDPEAFAHEQARLGTCWTLLGLTTDLAKDGDWIRARLGGKSVFVQRFGEMLKGFENVCRHRFFPLRTEDKGNGVIRCGFHHWQYDKEGRAVGIPHCQQLFGKTPREMNVRLAPVEVATCGALVFGRFAGKMAETLEEYLGEAWTILGAMTAIERPPHYLECDVRSNWKPLYHVTMDDYHLVAVHPTTFGKEGYLDPKGVRYFRFGRHSAYFPWTDEHALEAMVDECRAGKYTPAGYRIFQIFPNLLVLQVKVVMTWYITVQQYVPEAHDRTLVRVWYFRSPFPVADKTPVHWLVRRYLELWQPPFVRHYIRKISGEDHAVGEKMQTVARQIDGLPILGTQEERIVWFEEEYARVVGGKQ